MPIGSVTPSQIAGLKPVSPLNQTEKSISHRIRRAIETVTTFSGMKTCPARQRIENMFGKLKDWRRIHMRYDRCADVFMSAIALAVVVIFWL